MIISFQIRIAFIDPNRVEILKQIYKAKAAFLFLLQTVILDKTDYLWLMSFSATCNL